ncbi:hypothetical protein [Pyrococcus kukulkanii]|uniref:Uncharacterized protein n=1 Tax=Pyrococcus kukulkanii TaxID=1609559 RepID=A0ABV4T8Y0_9EURY
MNVNVRAFVIIMLIGLMFQLQLPHVAAYGSEDDEEGIIGKITNAIGDFFRSIIDGIKDFFGTIVDAIKWPFTQVKYMFINVYNWMWDHLGPLGVVGFVAIAGLTAWVAIFWFRQNLQQVKNW